MAVRLPRYVTDALSKGLKLHREGLSGDGLVQETVDMARRGVREGSWPEAKILKASAWFARHVADRQRMSEPAKWDDPPNYSPAYVAWLLWGDGGDGRGRRYIDRQAELIREKNEAPGDRSQSTPAPPSDRIKGSDVNPSGSAATRGPEITLRASVETSLRSKVRDHNEANPGASKRATLTMLKKVWRRGAGAYSTSHRPNVSRAAWAMARVNAFLFLLRNGRPQDAKYITDNDLLPDGHPKKSKSEETEMHRDGDYGSSSKILHAMIKDLKDAIDMMYDVDRETFERILIDTHDRYAMICGMPKHGEVEVDIEVMPDDGEDEYEGYGRRRRVRMGDAVEEPTDAQRSNLPAAAFSPAAFYANEDGEFYRSGVFLVSKSKLPHHINSVEDPNDNDTVDVPRLRNALARFDQVDWSEFPEDTMMRTRAHLERHADAILIGRQECTTCRKEDVEGLALDIKDFRMGKFSAIRERLNGKA